MKQFTVVCLLLALIQVSCAQDQGVETTSMALSTCDEVYQSAPDAVTAVCWHKKLNKDNECEKVWDDYCCTDAADGCESEYGSDVASYLGFVAHSNGKCTGNGSGENQCARFVQELFSERLHHSFKGSWIKAQNALDKVENSDLQLDEDPVFVFRTGIGGWMSAGEEAPRETDILVFSGGGFGHVVIAMAPTLKDGVWQIPIIEENVAKVSDYGPDGFCHHRVLVAKKDDTGKWNVDSGIGSGYKYTGFIRHNLAGIYADKGWHDDGKSQAFRDAYLAVTKETEKFSKKSLGWAFSDSEGSPFVHDVHGVTLQNFVNTNTDNRFGTDGQTALAYSPDEKVYLLKEGFWGAYKCVPGSDGKAMGGAEYLGAPTSNEKKGRLGDGCEETSDTSIQEVTYQRFEHGCMWWKDEVDGKVHVHVDNGMSIDADKATACGVKVENNPPSANCSDECSPGTQQCSDASHLLICGHPGADSCYHWLTMNCGGGTVCQNNACVTPSSSSGSGGSSSTSSSQGGSGIGGASSNQSDSSSQGGAPSLGSGGSVSRVCVPNATQLCQCLSNGSILNGVQVCVEDGSGFSTCPCEASVSGSGGASSSLGIGGASIIDPSISQGGVVQGGSTSQGEGGAFSGLGGATLFFSEGGAPSGIGGMILTLSQGGTPEVVSSGGSLSGLGGASGLGGTISIPSQGGAMSISFGGSVSQGGTVQGGSVSQGGMISSGGAISIAGSSSLGGSSSPTWNGEYEVIVSSPIETWDFFSPSGIISCQTSQGEVDLLGGIVGCSFFASQDAEIEFNIRGTQNGSDLFGAYEPWERTCPDGQTGCAQRSGIYYSRWNTIICRILSDGSTSTCVEVANQNERLTDGNSVWNGLDVGGCNFNVELP